MIQCSACDGGPGHMIGLSPLGKSSDWRALVQVFLVLVGLGVFYAAAPSAAQRERFKRQASNEGALLDGDPPGSASASVDGSPRHAV